MSEFHTLQDIIANITQFGDDPCLLKLERDDITIWSGNRVAEAVHRLARGLVQAGLKPGEYVTILAHNRPEWVVATLAIIAAGGAVNPIDSQIGRDALAHVLPDSEAKFIFTSTEYLNRLKDAHAEMQPILFDVDEDDSRGWQAMCSDDESIALPTVQPEDAAALFYTSGTTGKPKGVPLTHENLTFQLQAIHDINLLQPTDRVLMPLPMYHVYPFTVGTLTPLAFGVPLVLPLSLTGPELIRALNEGGATILLGVPRLYRALYDGILSRVENGGAIARTLFNGLMSVSIWLRRNVGWQVGKTLFGSLHKRVGPQVRVLTSGGSALDPDLAWKLEGLGWRVGIGYGLTETSPMLTINLSGDAPPKLSSVGPALPGVEIDLKPTEEAPSDQGEIVARGPSVFDGYRNLPDKTDEAIDGDGWFHTGDLGYKDDEGYIYINGRASTMIVTEGGKNVQPEPVEDVYQQHVFIREIGILEDDEKKLVGLIVPAIDEINYQRNGDVERAIREAVSEQVKELPSYQRIVDYAITPEPLPRTNLGKIRRHILKEQYEKIQAGEKLDEGAKRGPLPIEDMSEKDRELLEHHAAREVWDWLADRYSDRSLTPDTSPQFDLGVDSLAWLTLTLEIQERTGVDLSDEAIGRVNTVRDLLVEVQEAAEATTEGSNALENPEETLSEEQLRWHKPLNPFMYAFGIVIYYLLRLVAKLYFRLEVRGAENFPEEGNVAITPNHTSFLDAPLVAAALPYSIVREVYWAAAANIMFSNPFVRFISRFGQVFPIEHQRRGSGMRNLAGAAVVLKRQKNLIWFPEGTVTDTGEMLPFQQGIGLLLEKHPTQVVPTYIEGAHEALPRGDWLPSPKPITITFGEVYQTDELAQQGQGESKAARIVSGLREQIVSLEEEREQATSAASSPAR